MKKIVLSLIALTASVGASAGIFDPAYRVGKDKVATSIEAQAFQTSTYSNVKAAVGLTDKLVLNVDVDGTSATNNLRPYIGADFNVISGTAFNLDVIGGWIVGLSGGQNADDKEVLGPSRGQNGIDAAVKARGTVGKFSYGATARIDYLFADEYGTNSESGSVLGFGLKGDVAYALTPKFGFKAGIDYGFTGKQDNTGTADVVKAATTDLEVGTLYTGETFSVNPYISWNYGTASDGTWAKNWTPGWTYGIRVGTEI
jgi:hypothetical protein